MQIYPTILAGGFGKRLSPISTSERPKQFLDLIGAGESLLQTTVKRALRFSAPENIITIGNVMHEKLLLQHLSLINSDLTKGIILETSARNTAYAILLALSSATDGIFLIMPSDHFIDGKFYEDVQEAIKLAKKGQIVTFGIMPECVSTHYGYVLNNKFTEKPNYDEALNLIRHGALWNSGIFVATGKTLRQEFGKYYHDFSCNLSFDKAIMEKTDRMSVIKANFYWDDLGSLESIEKYATKPAMRLVS